MWGTTIVKTFYVEVIWKHWDCVLELFTRLILLTYRRIVITIMIVSVIATSFEGSHYKRQVIGLMWALSGLLEVLACDTDHYP